MVRRISVERAVIGSEQILSDRKLRRELPELLPEALAYRRRVTRRFLARALVVVPFGCAAHPVGPLHSARLRWERNAVVARHIVFVLRVILSGNRFPLFG